MTCLWKFHGQVFLRRQMENIEQIRMEEKMKKRIFKRKKRMTIGQEGKRVGRMLSLAAALCLLLSITLPVCGAENKSAEESGQSPKVVVTDIYHRHIGNEEIQGGCYSIPINHVHQGDEKTGGACYQTAIPHIHQGSADEGGGCYTNPVYHEHQGDEEQGGACYEPVIHTHTDDCYSSGICTVYYTQGDIIDTWYENCFNHQNSVFVRAQGTASHGDCGMGTVSTELIYCQSCGLNSPTVHEYSNLICGYEEGGIVEYRLSCDKTIDRYESGCGKEENEIESYVLSCNKDLDGYGLGCGLLEDVPCGKLIVTNETAGKEEQVTLSVKMEDLTGGRLKLCSEPYVWQDEKGNILGNGERIVVDKNGTYFVTLRLENKDVDERGLCSRILVDNIYKSQPSTTPKPTASPSHTSKPTAMPSSIPDASATPKSNVSEDSSPQDFEENESRFEEEGEGNEASFTEEEVKEESENVGKRYSGKENEPEPSPSIHPQLMKETKQVTIPKKEAMEEIQYKIEQKEKRNSFFSTPAARMITITSGLALLLLGIALLLMYLRRSVKIYNDDGEGRMFYLGRCMVSEEEDTYVVRITEAMVEKAYTNRYCIKPGLFRIGKKEGQELIVHKESKSVAVYLSKEIIVML